MRRFCALVIAGLAVAACGGGSGTKSVSNPSKYVPYPVGPWSAFDQGGFLGSCDSYASDAYCVCALKFVMRHYPKTSRLPGARQAGGTAVYRAPVSHLSEINPYGKAEFADCAGK